MFWGIPDTPFLPSPFPCWMLITHRFCNFIPWSPPIQFWGLWRQLVINFTEHVVGLNGFDFAHLVALWYAKNFFFTFCNHFLRLSEEFSLHSIVILFGIFYPAFSKKNKTQLHAAYNRVTSALRTHTQAEGEEIERYSTHMEIRREEGKLYLSETK